jgi:hypothetical protein
MRRKLNRSLETALSIASNIMEHESRVSGDPVAGFSYPSKNVCVSWIDDSRGRFKWVEIGDARSRDVIDVARDQCQPVHLGRGG